MNTKGIKHVQYKKQLDGFAVWIPTRSGNYLKTFSDHDLATLFVIKFGGGLKIIKNTYEYF